MDITSPKHGWYPMKPTPPIAERNNERPSGFVKETVGAYHGINEDGVSQTQYNFGLVLKASDLLADGSGHLCKANPQSTSCPSTKSWCLT